MRCCRAKASTNLFASAPSPNPSSSSAVSSCAAARREAAASLSGIDASRITAPKYEPRRRHCRIAVSGARGGRRRRARHRRGSHRAIRSRSACRAAPSPPSRGPAPPSRRRARATTSVRLVRLEYDRKLGDIEAPDGHQGSGAEFRRVSARIGDGIAGLAQRDQAKRRRQLDPRRVGRLDRNVPFGRHRAPTPHFNVRHLCCFEHNLQPRGGRRGLGRGDGRPALDPCVFLRGHHAARCRGTASGLSRCSARHRTPILPRRARTISRARRERSAGDDWLHPGSPAVSRGRRRKSPT